MSFHSQTLLVLNEISKMLKDMDLEYKDLVEKALAGLRRDIEVTSKAIEAIDDLCAEGEPAPLGAFSEKEIKDMEGK